MASITEFSFIRNPKDNLKNERRSIVVRFGKYDCTKISCVDVPVRGTAKIELDEEDTNLQGTSKVSVRIFK